MELVFICGSPVFDKRAYYDSHYENTHHLVCADQVFESQPSAGLRAVVNAVVSCLELRTKVLLIDSNISCQKIDSYVGVIRQKLDCRFICLHLLPKFGSDQYKIMREFARIQAIRDSHDSPFSMKSDFENVDVDCVDVEVRNIALGPELSLAHQLELPVLFLQSEAFKEDEFDCVKLWASNNPCGLVIAIGRGLKPLSIDSPVFVCEGTLSDFHKPPNQGLLVFLMALLHLDFRDPNSAYLYHSLEHRQMAENAGLRHCRSSKLIKTPKLILSMNSFVAPDIPEVLEKLTFRRVEQLASLPLCSGNTSVQISENLVLRRLSKNEEIYKKFHDIYVKNASLPNQSTSVLKELNAKAKTRPSVPQLPKPKPRGSTLPSWMREQPKQSPKRQKRDSVLKLEYVLNERELVDCAQAVLEEQDGSKDDCDIPGQGTDELAIEGTVSNCSEEQTTCLDEIFSGRKKAPRKRASTERLDAIVDSVRSRVGSIK